MFRLFLAVALLAVPVLAVADGPPEKATASDQKPAEKAATASDQKLAELEAKLQALLKEIQSLRGSKAETPKSPEKKDDSKLLALEKQKAELKKLQGLKDLQQLKLDAKKLADQQLKLEGKKLADMKDALKKNIQTELELEMKKLADMKERLKEKVQIELQQQGKDGKPRVVVIGPDGSQVKEPKIDIQVESKGTDKKVIEVDGKLKTMNPGEVFQSLQFYATDPNTVHLTRVTYPMSAKQANALAEFLAANAKAKVLETKVEGDNLVVTTTPEVQATISQVVALMTGKPIGGGSNYYRVVPSIIPSKPGALSAPPKAPAAPKPPAAPKAPSAPKAPAAPKKPEKV